MVSMWTLIISNIVVVNCLSVIWVVRLPRHRNPNDKETFENKDLFRRILGILLCQANLQHQRQPKSPRSEYFSSTLTNFQKYSKYFKTNQLSIYFQRYLQLIFHSFVLPQSSTKSTVETTRLLLLATGSDYLASMRRGFKADGWRIFCKFIKFHLLAKISKLPES